MLLDQLHDAEMSLADDYRTLGERHAAEHDLWHNCEVFARQCQSRAMQLWETAARYGKDLGEPHESEVFRSLAARSRLIWLAVSRARHC